MGRHIEKFIQRYSYGKNRSRRENAFNEKFYQREDNKLFGNLIWTDKLNMCFIAVIFKVQSYDSKYSDYLESIIYDNGKSCVVMD